MIPLLQNKSGVSGFCLFCSSRPSTALVVNRQSDTHAIGIYIPEGVHEGIVCLQHTDGSAYTYPWHQPLHCSRQLIRFVEVSNCQKQSVSDAFHNVVFPPYSRLTFFKADRRELTTTKLVQIN